MSKLLPYETIVKAHEGEGIYVRVLSTTFCPLQPRGKFSLSDEADKLKRYKSSRICDIRYISFACDMPLARYVPSARERTACA